jgi:hypothetical protein
MDYRIELVKSDSRLHGDVGAVDLEDPVHPVERHQVPVGHRRIGERVATTDRLHPLAGPCGLQHDRRDLIGRGRLVYRRWNASLVASPVPCAHSHPASVRPT